MSKVLAQAVATVTILATVVVAMVSAIVIRVGCWVLLAFALFLILDFIF